MNRARNDSGAARVLVKTLTALGFTALIVVSLMWLSGAFQPKIDDHREGAGPTAGSIERPVGSATLAEARMIRVPRTESAVGSIRAVHETSLSSKLLAEIVEVNVTAGAKVAAGDVVVRLDDEDLQARLKQAQAVLQGARAGRKQANTEYERISALFERDSAARIELDRAETALHSAEAEVLRAEQAVREAETLLEYTAIRSPLDGVVVDKLVEVGDTATPGQPLLVLYDPTRMQLVASVRESLTRRLKVGEDIEVQIEALQKRCRGTVSEIVPEAEAASRTFSVKVTGPCPAGIYSGMFGRLIIPLDDEEVLVVPQAAIREVGQLRLVDVADGDRLQRRAVTLGRQLGEDVEVLSGLRPGEKVALRHGGSEPKPEG
jgi:RND family efflux transporter MFP subunit